MAVIELEKTATEIRWGDAKKWVEGDWYPMPVGFFERDQDEYVIDGYDIFMQDPKKNGDINPVDFDGAGPFIFSEALRICEAHNKRKML